MTQLKRAETTPEIAAGVQEDGQWPMWAVFGVVLAATLAAYFPALSGGFLWDDAGHVTNPALQPWTGLGRIWFEVGATQQYYPLLHTAFWIEHRLWGEATVGYHLINILWHVSSACLLVSLLRRLAVRGAVLAGLIFALHPVCVESVAWISEQKNTLATVFYLAAALTWLRFEEDRRAARYLIASLWFVAALLTKSVTATLPAALLVMAWWRRGRLSWRSDVWPLLPWFACGVTAGLGTAWFEATQIGASGGDFALGAMQRGLLAGRVVWFYLGKLIWPTDLAFFYPRWEIDANQVWQWGFPGAALLLLLVLVCLRKYTRAPLAAVLLYGGTLFPVLGFVNVYPFVFSYVADHFQYLALLGMIPFLLSAGMRGFTLLKCPEWSGPALALSVILILGLLTWRQCRMYRDVITLYETTLARNHSSWVAQLNLGTALDEAGQPENALRHLQRALELKPDCPETLNSLGNVLNRLGRSSESLPLLSRAVQLQPRFAAAHNTLGVTLMTMGRAENGTKEFRRAVQLAPRMALARTNLGWALANQRMLPEALSQFEEAAAIEPSNADNEFKWGLALAMHGKLPEARSHLAQAVELQPDNANMRYTLGSALLDLGKGEQAIEQFEETLRLEPNHAAARASLEDICRTGMAR